MGGKGSNTTVSQNGPPQAFLDAYNRVQGQAQNVAQIPYQPYQGQTVAQLSPDQVAGLGSIENLNANGGAWTPYLQSAQGYFNQATQPVLTPALQARIDSTQLTPDKVQSWENPWTQDVVNATQAQFANQNAQQQAGVSGNAISQGAFGGDREAVAHALTAEQENLTQAPVIAGLESQGYTTGLQAATTQGQLGLQGTQIGLGADEAQRWLASQAGFGEANLGQEAQSLGLAGAASQLQAGSLEQQMAQENLNIPYEQYIAAQAYPFQTTGWLANISEGLGGASGGTSSTTTPAPSTLSQVGGLAAGTAGILGSTGAFGNSNNGGSGWLSSLFGGGGGPVDSGSFDTSQWQRGGGLQPRRASGGMAGVPDVSLSVVPGASGLGDAPMSHGTPLILKNYGQTSTTDQGSNVLGDILGVAKTAATVASFFQDGGPVHRADGGATDGMQPASSQWYEPLIQENLANQMAAELTPSGMKSGGMVPRQHFEVGGFSAGMESPWWARSEERQATERHGLLASPVAGRTDHLAVAPETGSYVIPADVVSGLGEGNTLAGANVMQKILETGPHGLRMPISKRGMGPPRPPPAYRESDTGLADGGEVAHYATGGLLPAQTYTPGAGINASTGQGTSNTGLPAVDAYLNSTEQGAIFTPPSTTPAPVAPANTANAGAFTADQIKQITDAQAAQAAQQAMWEADSAGAGAYGGQASGGAVQRRAPGGDVGPDDGMMGFGDDTGDDTGLPPAPPPPMQPPVHSDIVVPKHMAPKVQGPPGPPARTAMSPSMVAVGDQGHHASASGDFDTYLSHLHPSQPDPWLALAEAGFATAAGRSPYALQNVGAGAARGVQAYMQQKQEAAKEGLQAGETAARMADTAAYREGMMDWRNRGLDQKQADNAERERLMEMRTNNAMQVAMIRALNAEGRGRWSYVGVNNDGMPIFLNGNSGETRVGNAAIGVRPDVQAKLDQGQQKIDALKEYHQWQMTHGNASQTEAQRWHSYLQSKGATDEDIRLWTGSRDINGKPTMTQSQAHQEGERLRGQNAPDDDGTSAPPPSAPPPGATPGNRPPLSTIFGQ